MALFNRSTLDGVAFNKKHDAPTNVRQSPTRHSWLGLRRRRIAFAILALLAVYLFVSNIPTDVAPVSQRYNQRFGSLAPGPIQAQLGDQSSHDANAQHPSSGTEHDTVIKFENLAPSLRPHFSQKRVNNNVLFALPEISSTILVPVACQMAMYNRSSVHVVLLGRQNIALLDLLVKNGISTEDCPIYWHDARPDRASDLSQERIQEAIRSGLAHTCSALRPQVILVDDSSEQLASGQSIRSLANRMGVSLLTLPDDVPQSLPWLPSLEISSLRTLNSVEIDIVIQAYSQSAGSLIRLVDSIQDANYRGLPYPRLTIELPTETDPFLLRYLERVQWPPGSTSGQSLLNLRHRVQPKTPDVGEASMHTIESFYPRTASTSHVVLLSPNAELAPSYYHYLMLTLLEYKYGTVHQGLSDSLFGISLHLPRKNLDGREPLFQPTDADIGPVVLMQRPDSDGALIMGDKWIDFHAFISHRFTHDANLAKTTDASTSVSREHPHWLREALDLMLTQGQYMIYPRFAASDDLRLLTVHLESQQIPEEFVAADEANEIETDEYDLEQMMSDDIPTNNNQAVERHDRTAHLNAFLPIQKLLTFGENPTTRALPLLGDVPLFTFSGQRTDWAHTRKSTLAFANDFSLQQGGCKSLDDRGDTTQISRIDILFCEEG